jgi:ABC-type tungstate transport system substrate-binding protein
MNKIENIKQLDALVSQTYMLGIIAAIIALVLAFIIAYIIKFQGGKGSRDHIIRRNWYIAIGLVATIGFFLYNFLYVSTQIAKAPLQAKFSTANIIATLALLGIYIVVGILTMLVMRNTKWGSILGKSRK